MSNVPVDHGAATAEGIRFERRGAAGIVTLDRPKALNALTLGMVGAMRRTLLAWAGDPHVHHVVLRAASDRAFCVGGDVRAVSDLATTGRMTEALAFFREEYPLNHLIGTYPKPFVSLVDGLCFGGGFGLSGHGRYRVAGEKLGFAMPEVAIGLFPDVGGTYVLPRLPGWSGTWLALTGARIGMSDAVALGLYTHHVPTERWPDLIAALAEGDAMDSVLGRFSIVPPEPSLGPLYPLIDRVFAGGSIEAILTALDHAARGAGVEADFAQIQRATLARVSPTSLAVTFELMRRGPALDLAANLKLEFRVVRHLLLGHDFHEGVRALLIDKDQAPRWKPDRLSAVDRAAVASWFDTPLADEMSLPVAPEEA